MLLALCCAVALADTPPTPLATTLREVSVHPGGALVTRRATLPAGDGRFVVAGLPASLDPDSVRLRLEGAEANDVEVRAAQNAAPADDRLATLRAKVDERSAARDAARDGAALERALRVRLEALLDQEAAAHATEVQGGRSNATTWEANFSYLSGQLLAARKSERAATIALEEAEQALAAAQAELGTCAAQQTPRTFEVTFAVVALTEGAHELALDYQVGGASWSPRYDLRADAQLASVALTYRAEVVQQTGEEWRDVEVWLSTAEPRRGVVGPEARAAWLDVQSAARKYAAAHGRATARERWADKSKDDGEIRASIGAAVERDALSVRYKLPRKETLESRPGATTVLLGHATLDVKGERVCTPALDRDVWIRGRATNRSEWILLPGPAAVFFGNDFVGPAALELVRPEEEFTLHLGRDPGWLVTRTHVEDRAGSAGLFGSKREQADRWTIRLENQGALAGAADGSATVQVREVLETAHDDRIEVELDDCTPAPSKGGRFDREREEKGILTWELTVARGGAATIDWTRLLTWPDDEQLQHGGGTLSFGPGGSASGGAGSGASSVALLPLAALVVALAAGLSLALLVAWRHRARHQLPRPGVAAATALLLLASAASNASAQEAVASRVAEVTVYGDGARVERHATLPGSGTWLLRDLPFGADPASIRVRIADGEIVRVETRERRERHLPDSGLEALRRRVRDVAQQLAAQDDEGAALAALGNHLAALLAPTAARPAGDGAARPDAKAWADEQAFLATRLAAHQKATRDHARARAAKQRELEAAQQELQSGEAIDFVVRDVVVDAVARKEGPLACVVSYLVQSAGWAPEYELRATRDLAHVELTYRARVFQQTDEPWNDVALVLSTAAPRRGAAGPDPEPQPLTLQAPEPTGGAWRLGFASDEAAPAEMEAIDAMGAAAPSAPPAPTRAPPFATVASEGLSERFALPDRQTIEPRGDGQRVLIGRATLPLAIERWCVPAEDPTVWLRGKAKNTSPWTLLPGRTAVHVGADYLGRGTLALTPAGSEAQLHLGPDPWLAVERRELSDHLATSAFSDSGTRRHSFRIEMKNLGAPGGAADGSVAVIVQESLPRARDERIEVALAKCTPRPSEGGDDRRAREEKGLLTWRLSVPRGTKATTIEWGWSADYPKELRLLESRE